jgi:nucleoside-diphosphate-sugar epimerase
LLADGHEVLGIDSFLDYYPRPYKEGNLAQARKQPKFQLIEADLNDAPLDGLVSDRDWIFHQAAQPGVRASWGEHFQDYVRANIAATQRLLEAAIRAKALDRFVFASSSSVYGNARQLPVHEDAETLPISPYGLTKLTAERLCLIYASSFGLPVVGLRYFTVYGPRQRPDMAFHRFGRALIEGREIHVFGNGSQTRDFTYVADVVEANLAAVKSRARGVFNIGGGSRMSLLDAIRTMEQVSGRPANLRYEEVARGDVTDTAADTSRAAAAFGYRPKIDLRHGLDAQIKDLERLYSQNAFRVPR